jgi:hypothetical protein
MADQKLTEITAATALTTDDTFYSVNDPGGTPADKSVTGLIMARDLLLPANGATSTTASGTVTLTDASYPIQLVNPNGAGRDVGLPTAAVTNHGFYIKNTAATSTVYALTVKEGSTVRATLNPGDAEVFLSSGSAWTRLNRPKRIYVDIVAFGTTVDTAIGDGKAYWQVPALFSNMNLVYVLAWVATAGTTNTTDIQIYNVTQTADMLSTVITIDTGEVSSATAAAAAVIDTGNDDVAVSDMLRIDVDAVSTTAAKGLTVRLGFELP